LLVGEKASVLAASADEAPSIVVGVMKGGKGPQVRHFVLDKGGFGVGFDVVYDIGVSAVDGKPLYMQTM
jgi:hypothetical protein